MKNMSFASMLGLALADAGARVVDRENIPAARAKIIWHSAADRFLKKLAEDRVLSKGLAAQYEIAVCTALDTDDALGMQRLATGFVSDQLGNLTPIVRTAADDLCRASQGYLKSVHACPNCGTPNPDGAEEEPCRGCS